MCKCVSVYRRRTTTIILNRIAQSHPHTHEEIRIMHAHRALLFVDCWLVNSFTNSVFCFVLLFDDHRARFIVIKTNKKRTHENIHKLNSNSKLNDNFNDFNHMYININWLKNLLSQSKNDIKFTIFAVLQTYDWLK